MLHNLPSELQTNTCAHHRLTGEVYMWIIVELPKPMRPVIVDSHTYGANVLTGILMSRLEDAIEGNAVVAVQLVAPQQVRVLLAGVQTHIKDRVSLNPIVTAELVSDSKLH